jgi:hypothetical protein
MKSNSYTEYSNTDYATTMDEILSLVAWYYQSILGRDPEPGSAEGWKAEIERIASLGIDIKEGFIALGKMFFNSEEYFSKNTSNGEYIIDLYETFLGRTPTSGEVNYWEGELAGGLSREMILINFVFSQEFILYMEGIFGDTSVRPEYNLLMDLYRGILSTLPDTGGFNFWLAIMQEAQCTGPEAVQDVTRQIAESFVSSPGYAARNRDNGEYITDLYDTIFRRGADLPGYLFYLGEHWTPGS